MPDLQSPVKPVLWRRLAFRASTAPASLLARTTLTLTVSSLLIAIIATLALVEFVIDPIAERSADDEAALLVLSAQTWVELPPDARPYFELELAENHDLIVSPEIQALPPMTTFVPYLELLQEALSERLETDVSLLRGAELVWVNVPMGGQTLQIGFADNRRNIQPLYVAVVIVTLGAAIVFLTSLFIVNRIARPLVQAAEKASTFRGSGNFEPLPEEGPRELVTLARSFNTMARDITQLLANRTTLLAGISHDLRTPLARMRVAVELLPENVDPVLKERFERNLESMDDLIGDALRFARGTGEIPQEVDLVEHLGEVLAHFDPPVPLLDDDGNTRTGSIRVSIATSAFRRVVSNLIDNGRRHATGVRVVLNESTLRVIDSGVGIPQEHRLAVFQPFFRLDNARGATTGGSGLGLAIVYQLCQAQGWRVSIHEAQGGGTDVWLQFADVDVAERVDGEVEPVETQAWG